VANFEIKSATSFSVMDGTALSIGVKGTAIVRISGVKRKYCTYPNMRLLLQ
jgi:hypothetical protein